MANSHRRASAPRRTVHHTVRNKPTHKSIAVSAGVATLATGAAIVVGAAVSDPAMLDLADSSSSSSLASAADHSADGTPKAGTRRAADRRELTVSRSGDRVSPLAAVQDLGSDPRTTSSGSVTPVKRWTTDSLDLWAAYGKHAPSAGEIESGKPVLATGRTVGGRDEIVVGGKVVWVSHGYLSSKKPAASTSSASGGPATAGISDAPCPDGSVENGLTAGTIRVYRAVCHAFPQVKDYIGLGPRTEHDTGHAIDVMVYDNKALGDQIAAWVKQHAAEFDLYDLIWYDRIWTPARSSEGWRDYGDHGSPTANHMDHVHIGTN